MSGPGPAGSPDDSPPQVETPTSGGWSTSGGSSTSGGWPASLRILVVLVALASVGVTMLIILNVARHAGSHQADVTSPQPGGDTWSRSALPQPLPGPVFALTDQSNQAFGSKELEGKAWIATFVFTRCAGPCPRITASVAGLQRELRDWPQWNDIRLVSISVDPEHDTPEALAAYAKSFDADLAHWRFLTGERAVVWPLVKDDFHLPVDEATANATMPILHSLKFVLIDRQGRLRGYYDALETEGRANLLHDLRRVLEE